MDSSISSYSSFIRLDDYGSKSQYISLYICYRCKSYAVEVRSVSVMLFTVPTFFIQPRYGVHCVHKSFVD